MLGAARTANWAGWWNTQPNATGGTVSYFQPAGPGTQIYKIHTFSTVGTDTFTVTSPGQMEYTVCGSGGGGGGGWWGSINQIATGGSGGAGAQIKQSGKYWFNGSYTVTVGAAGTGGQLDINGDIAPTAGGNSSVWTITATGGNPGSNCAELTTPGPSGGSNSDYAGGTGFARTYVGGNDLTNSGGGAGARAVGGNAANPNTGTGGVGGDGLLMTGWYTDQSNVYFGSGGGGAKNGQGGADSGGDAGTGDAYNQNPGGAGTWYGSGGGGGWGGTADTLGSPGGDGYKGVVMIRYKVPTNPYP